MFRPLLSLPLIAALGLAGCGCGDDAHDTGSAAGNATGATVSGTGTTGDGTSATDPTSANGTNATAGSGTADAPALERMRATSDLSGLRATLMAELDLVRTRLNDGTRTKEAAAADKERAAELAQGLERLDRALAAVGASNDTTWSALRASSLQEVNDIKAWMAQNGLRTS